MPKRNPTCGCGDEGVCNEAALDCNPCCRCIPQRLCATFNASGCSCDGATVLMYLSGNGEYQGTLPCAGETMDIRVSLHYENDTCYWRVVSEAFYIDELFEIDGTEGRTCEDPVLEIDAPFYECTGTITIQKQLSMQLPTVDDEEGCARVLCTGCQCFSPWLCVEYHDLDCFGVAYVYYDEGRNLWEATINTQALESQQHQDPCYPTACPVITLQFYFDVDYDGSCILVLLRDGIEYTATPTCISGGGFTANFPAGFTTTINVSNVPCSPPCSVCCPDSPDELTATVTFGCCSSTLTLNRVHPGMDYWIGSSSNNCTGHPYSEFPGADLNVHLVCRYFDNTGESHYLIRADCGKTCDTSFVVSTAKVLSCQPFHIEAHDQVTQICCSGNNEASIGSVVITE